MISNLQSSQQLQTYLESNQYLVANFTADWCGPCQAIKPTLEELYAQCTNIEIVKINLDKFQDIASQYSVTSIPTFIFFEKKSEVDRLVGADIAKLRKKILNFQNLSKSNNGFRNGLEKPNSSKILSQINQFIPSGFSTLNSTIDYSGYQVLNHDINDNIKHVFDLSTDQGISSDSDSQLLIYIPLLNSCKVHLIILKFNQNIDEDYQLPNLMKIWTNLHHIISFDEIDVNVVHEEKIDSNDTWYIVKLKFVKFQNITSLTLFFDGEDEDLKTKIDKIVLVGLGGEPLNQGTLTKEEN